MQRLKLNRSSQHPIMGLAAPAPISEAELSRELHTAIAAMAKDTKEQAQIDRVNNLPFSNYENRHKIGITFRPIEQLLIELETTGQLDAVGDQAVFQPDIDVDELYPIAESFLCICDTYELIALDRKVTDEGAPLRLLAERIGAGQLVSVSQVANAKKAISWMRQMTRQLTPKQFSDFSVAIQIRATLALKNEICNTNKFAA